MTKIPAARRNLLICLGLAISTLLLYFQVRHFALTDYDDDLFIGRTSPVELGLTLRNLCWAFTTSYAYTWHPLTWISYMLDCQLWGPDPGAIHLVNALFHVFNVVLLFLIFNRMTRAPWRSAFVAALFAFHPCHVESVAWVAERKDVLSSFFWMLTVLAYVRYVEKPDPKRYALCLGGYVLALLSKPMVITLPFVLLLLDYWPLGRTRWEKPAIGERTPFSLGRLLKEKTPFLLLAAICAMVAYATQTHGHAVASAVRLPFLARLENSIVSYVRYIGMMLWPVHLTVFYPYAIWKPITVIVAAVGLIVVTLLVDRQRRNKPYLLVGWLWYLGTLVPVIGLVQVGHQALVDHHTYIPYVGLFIMIAWSVPDSLFQRTSGKWLGAALASGVLVPCIVLSWFQIQTWKNSGTLFQRVFAVTRPNPFVLGYLTWRQVIPAAGTGAPKETKIKLLQEPNLAEAHVNLGTAYLGEGRVQDAITEYQKALHYEPDQEFVYTNIGNLMLGRGDFDGAIEQYRQAVRVDPDNAKLHNNLGVMYSRQKRTLEAVEQYKAALKINPDFLPAHANLAHAYADEGRIEEANAENAEIQRIKENQPSHVPSALP